MSKLTENEIIELISLYQSSIKKLDYQKTTSLIVIKELQGQLKEAQKANRHALAKAKAKSKTENKKKTTVSAITPKEGSIKKSTADKKGPKAKAKSPQQEKTSLQDAAQMLTSVPPVKQTPAPEAAPKAIRRKPGRPRKKAEPIVVASSENPTEASSVAPETKPRKRPGRPPKSKPATKTTAKKRTATKTTRKPAAKATAAKTSGGYKLSDWDQLFMDAVTAAKEISRSELEGVLKEKGAALTDGMDEKQVTTKISNVLHKLTNTRKLLERVKNDDNKTVYRLA